jgi:hypothetical protein
MSFSLGPFSMASSGVAYPGPFAAWQQAPPLAAAGAGTSTSTAPAIFSSPCALRSRTNHQQKTKRPQPFRSALVDRDRTHRSTGDEEDGEAKLLTHSPEPDKREEMTCVLAFQSLVRRGGHRAGGAGQL